MPSDCWPSGTNKGAGTTCPFPSRTGRPEPELSAEAQAPPATQAALGLGSLTTESIPSTAAGHRDVSLRQEAGAGEKAPSHLLPSSRRQAAHQNTVDKCVQNPTFYYSSCAAVRTPGTRGHRLHHHAAGPPASHAPTQDFTRATLQRCTLQEDWETTTGRVDGQAELQCADTTTGKGGRGQGGGRWPQAGLVTALALGSKISKMYRTITGKNTTHDKLNFTLVIKN